MKIDQQAAYYDTLWAKRKRLNSLKLMRSVQILNYFTIVKRKIKNPKILDLGCGDGRLTAFLGEFADTDAIELSKEAIRIAKEKHPHVNFFQGDALTYNLKFNYYDLVISQEVIEHIENQEAYISVCHKVLKKNGYLIMTTPNKKVFDHLEGGSWSHQPIEKIMRPKTFKILVNKKFKIISYDSIIFNFGHKGYFKLLNSRYVIGITNRLGLKKLREFFLSKCGYGLHQCVIAKKA
ncbi:class I SAM-dependent methyltransferase [Xanthomarina gelatinilytica]|uniref:class I SAM-dependent methyltransferase n=1 Tax=Xanthomarina gelatinilytica TaxID=1137281 RepID=UPI003AA8266F